MSRLTLLTLPPSPNNIKVRLALALKRLECEFVPQGFDDRSLVIEKSGQPLTPVLLDGDRVVFDSFGILRYLDANFDGPRLFPETREGIREIESWENHARNGLGPALGMILSMLLSGKVDPAQAELASRLFNQLASNVELALEKGSYLTGEAISAADLTIAPLVYYAVQDADKTEEGSVQRFFAEHLQLSPRYPRTRAWVDRVFAIENEVEGAGAGELS